MAPIDFLTSVFIIVKSLTASMVICLYIGDVAGFFAFYDSPKSLLFVFVFLFLSLFNIYVTKFKCYFERVEKDMLGICRQRRKM